MYKTSVTLTKEQKACVNSKIIRVKFRVLRAKENKVSCRSTTFAS